MFLKNFSKMDYSWKIFKSVLQDYKKEALEKNQPFGFAFEFLEMEMQKKEQEMFAEQRDVDKEGEAILNISMTQSVASIRKKGKRVRNLRSVMLLKKRSALQRKIKLVRSRGEGHRRMS
uniref:Uncharacterized protein n=1 Tax=Micrurus spixii TaxID=129469 RepID=A0A2D4LQY0_9SAUR